MNFKLNEYESQLLIELTASAVNDETLDIPRKATDWNKIYKFANFHRCANSLYPVLITMKDVGVMSLRCEEQFRQAAISTEKCRKSMENIK